MRLQAGPLDARHPTFLRSKNMRFALKTSKVGKKADARHKCLAGPGEDLVPWHDVGCVQMRHSGRTCAGLGTLATPPGSKLHASRLRREGVACTTSTLLEPALTPGPF